MGIRKQPFGYRVEMGEVVSTPKKQSWWSISSNSTFLVPHLTY